MFGLNNLVPTGVVTQDGIKNIHDLIYGDKVYEYETGKMLEVKDIVKMKSHNIWEVKYTDRRSEIYSDDEWIFTGGAIMPLKEAMKRIPFTEIMQYPVDFNPGKIIEPLHPDPYVAGALLTYGNFDNEFVNLPADMFQINNQLANKYHLDYGAKLGVNTVYFSYDNKRDTDLIKWTEFFPQYDMYVRTGQIDSPIFPNEYVYASMNDRRQFIRGIFDIGYDPRTSKDVVSINCKNEMRLKKIQHILWSMGILSSVEYSGFKYNDRYTLTILGAQDQYPGFFYNIAKIEHMLDTTNKTWSYYEHFKLKIDRIGRVQRGYTLSKGYMYNIVLEKPHMRFLSANFLPRVSM